MTILNLFFFILFGAVIFFSYKLVKFLIHIRNVRATVISNCQGSASKGS